MTGRILVTGAAGRLGASVVAAFAGYDVIAYRRAALDITDPEAVRRAIGGAASAVVINCAAFNDVDGAETRPTDALAVNAFAVRSLARAAETCGATFVHFGTDFVFDGNATEPYGEEAVPSPRSVYALSKLLGEWFALDAPRGFVLRVESLFGAPAGWSGRPGSLDAIVEGLEQGRDVRVFTDRVVSPSYAHDVARAVRHLVETTAPPGVYHCVNSGRATWYDVAEEAARLLGVRPRLQPIRLDQVALKATRPRFCALANRKLAATGFTMPAWNDALRRWLTERGARRDNRDNRDNIDT
ncbi:MAG: dTDP-4-dehydrorhamnose reductase, partial [Acidobacteria bacterium]|nr:dTDP-4-dehydrorhamnose reductase [Acidobacteriota bacterium]